MTATTLQANIAGTVYPVKNKSYTLSDKVDQRSTVTLTIIDSAGSYSFQYGQPITVTDALEGVRFVGYVHKPSGVKYEANAAIAYTIDCIDKCALAGWRTTNRSYINQYAGVIAAGMVNDVLSAEGITANYAIRDDNTQTEFGQGTLSGTVATANLGGDLELTSAGSTVTITENTSGVFGAGTLNNCQTSGNTLIPTPTPTIKLVGSETLNNDGNAYTYIKIFSSGSIGIISGRYLAYDIWVDPSSPTGQSGVDIVFTDGTTLRDATQDYRYYDAQNIPPHPNHDLSGFANGRWYHRSFLLDNFVGKTISYVTVVFEGDKTGTYTTYIKNIQETDSGGSTVNTFFGSSFNVNPPQQLQNSGYSGISCTIVNTYDCVTVPTNRVSGSTSISGVGIVRNSFLDWVATTPANTNVQIEYSLDGGNSYIVCTNNTSLPGLLAGLSVGSMSIQFRETFQQLAGASPESQPVLSSLIVIINPSYAATKSDVTLSAATNTQWNAGTLTNTQTNNGVLSLLGLIRNFNVNNTDLSGFTIFGDGATGPSFSTISMHCNFGTMWVQTGINMEGHARYDSVGTWANGTIECDIYIDGTVWRPSIEYRRTADSNYDANYAYAVEYNLNSVQLQKGSNSSASSAGTRTLVASATVNITTASWHRAKIIFNGSSHQIFIDDVRYINATDGTYTAAGHVSFRASDASASAGYQGQFNNFGITVVGLSGTWVSASTSLTAAGTYGGSVITWQDASIGTGTSILVESTTNGGSTWQTVTNGGTITSLTPGQSLSGVNLQLRVTLSTQTASSMPQIQYLVCRVLGGYSSSGTRISPVLSLTNAGTAGSTVVNWAAITPANTTITVATSPNGSSSWTNVSNGGAIAGITTQPAPQLDSFTVDDHTSYTHLQRTGGSAGTWTWDTANSRLSVTGGTSDMQLWTAISVADIDIVLDLDQSDRCGIVWRESSASNFYELDIYDGSSNAGLTNVMQLFKVVSNVKTQLGSNATISLARGTPKRVRVTMVGTAITVLFEGVSVFSTTDSSLASAGKAGIIEVSGIGRFYNLRLQPQGQSLSGVNAYTRVTLSSTDPTVTPQVTDLVLCALHPNIGLGALVPRVDYLNTYLSANLDDLAKKSSTYYWNIDQSNKFTFLDRYAIPAPYVVNSSDQKLLIAGPLTIDYVGDLYHNRHTCTGVNATGSFSENKTGDGQTTSWALGNNVAAIPIITLNGQIQTVGQKGIDTGKQFYYQLGNNTIYQDASGTVLQQIDTLSISYTGRYVTSVTVDNTGPFAGTTSISQFAAITGGTGIVEVVEDVSSLNMDITSATDHCNGQLTRDGVIGRIITFESWRSNPSLAIGQFAPIFIPEQAVNDALMLISQIDTTQDITIDPGSGTPTHIYYQKVTALEGPNMGPGWKLLASAFQ